MNVVKDPCLETGGKRVVHLDKHEFQGMRDLTGFPSDSQYVAEVRFDVWFGVVTCCGRCLISRRFCTMEDALQWVMRNRNGWWS